MNSVVLDELLQRFRCASHLHHNLGEAVIGDGSTIVINLLAGRYDLVTEADDLYHVTDDAKNLKTGHVSQ